MAGITNKASLIMKEKGKPFPVNGEAGVMSPLVFGGGKQLGVVFPFTPTIQLSHTANYGTYDPAGSIAQQSYYMNTSNATISITALFPSNTEAEAAYTAAAIHFFKTCTRSDFGIEAGANAGTPPPILKLSCFGYVHASNVPCVIRNFMYTLPEDTDYVEIDVAGEKISVPTLSLLSVELAPQLTPKKVKDMFDIRKFASGDLLKGNNEGGFM